MRIAERAGGWIGPIAVAVMAFLLRVWDVDKAKGLLFDETYYAKHAWSLLQYGYVRDFTSGADRRIAAGDLTDLFAQDPTQIAHPDGGKWLIAIGEHFFGLDPFGWRISAVVVGALTVLVLARLVRRLTGSTWLGCLAGLLLCLDGMHFVMSRLALLDGFLTFWIVCAVAALVADRDAMARRVALSPAWLPVRPWLVVAGACLGMAVATKWSALVFLAVFGLLVVGWEVVVRRRARWDGGELRRRGARWWARTLLVVGTPAFVWLVVVAAVVYSATWSGWMVHHELYAERFDLDGSLLSQWWGFHRQTWDFHTGDYLAGQSHPYASSAWGWPLLDRPVAVDAHNDLPAESCGAAGDSSCIRVITLLGNPAVWWMGSLAMLASVAMLVLRGSWRHGLAVAGFAAGWLPWLVFTDRPIFSFYAVVMLPFMIIATALVLKSAWDAVAERGRRVLLATAIAYLVVVAVAFWWFHPVLTDALLSRDAWLSRMWFSRWI